MLNPNRPLAGRYELGTVLGKGGMAEVYRAWDTVLERSVAVKVLRHTLTENAELERFTAEARTLARLDHPGLVSIYDTGIEGDQPYLVMELVEGTTLARLLGTRELRTVEAVSIATALAEVLAYVHGRDVTHRDIKPGNVLIDRENHVLLADFGVARSASSTQTAPGTMIGTAAYLSPEQVRSDQVTPASDVYALGLLLIECLSGARVYTGSPDVAALARLLSPPPLDDVPEPLRGLVSAMTAADPQDRPTAAAVAAGLRGHLGITEVEPETMQLARPIASVPAALPVQGLPVAAGPYAGSEVRTAVEPPGPRRWHLAALAGVAAGLAVLATAIWGPPVLDGDGAGNRPSAAVPNVSATPVPTGSTAQPTAVPTLSEATGEARPAARQADSKPTKAPTGADPTVRASTNASAEAAVRLILALLEERQQTRASATPTAGPTPGAQPSATPSAGTGDGDGPGGGPEDGKGRGGGKGGG